MIYRIILNLQIRFAEEASGKIFPVTGSEFPLHFSAGTMPGWLQSLNLRKEGLPHGSTTISPFIAR